ncbi:hypothetical protein N7457_000353 [Penicillium paradoxum]|uniref:uncharacterized protein n=1 Tax=Penicillium paradoxum TaxID=176176 RepID=UPI002547F6DC|nr:uncharacterized protein N7457_000353 [Penicillium paradoxum]KAJ5793754.1 hypothetical protein N7457_000353 [Penicillium paradoxum]
MSKPKIPRGFEAWYDKLLTIAQQAPVPTTQPLLQHIENIEPSQLPTISVSDISLQQTEIAFGIKQANGPQPWMVPDIFFSLPADFGKLTKVENKKTNSRCRIDALIFVVYRNLLEQDLLPNTGDSRATLSFETPFKSSPILINGVPHTCTGTADYTVLFGRKDHMACHIVVLEAEKRYNLANAGQLLAYMGMVQANRKAHGQSNCSVWGCLSDGWEFRFYFLDLRGNWSSRTLSSNILGWQEIANMLAHMIIHAQAVANSTFHPRLCSTRGPSTQPSLVVSSEDNTAPKRKSTPETVERPIKMQCISIRGSDLSEIPDSVTSEVSTIDSLEIRLDDCAAESQSALDRVAESD